MEISSGLYHSSPKSSSYLCGVKESLYFLGLCEPHLATPLLPVERKHKEDIIQNLERILLNIRNV
jgi:4-hydroxy-tetrahydrodipicolinate synthase